MESTLRSFEEFYRAEYSRLAGSLLLVCGDDFLAEEFAQEAFARALNHWDRVSVMERPGGWLYRTAFNLVRRHWSRKRLDKVVLSQQADRPQGELERLDVVAALSHLPVSQRQAVVLRYILDCSTSEAAEAMELSDGALRMTLHRAIDSLRTSGLVFDEPSYPEPINE